MNESNPVISRLWRGDGVESIHRGAWVVVTADSELVDGRGDPNQLVYARSSTKSIQALPMFETGTAAALSLTDEEIAVTVSSHNGEPGHVDATRSILTKAGLTASSLLCGPQAPSGSAYGAAAERITNNCSGKHAGFLATAVALGDDPAAYLSPDSSVQRAVRRTLVEVTGANETEVSTSIDGCSAPTFRLPLAALATGLARMANPEDLAPVRASACTQILRAARRHPEMIGGTVTPRFDTDLLAATNGRVFAKAGADGVQTVGIVGDRVGFAAKIDDGSSRALHRLTLGVLRRLGFLHGDEHAALRRWHDPIRRNWDGIDVGRHEVSDDVLPSRVT